MGDPRNFIKRVLESGLDLGILTAEDVLRHATIEVLTQHLPPQVKARLLKASLESSTMTKQLIVDTVGFDSLVEYVPSDILWACIASGAARGLGQQAADFPAPATSRNGALRRRITRQPPPPPGAGVRDTASDIPVPTPVASPGSGSVPLPDRKPNVSAPPAAVGVPGSVSRHARPGTLDRALDALEIDEGGAFPEKTRTGESARPEFTPDRTDVFPQDKVGQPRSDWNDDETNPGGSRRGGY